jgi:outer membrane protein OmpA-like peptidoglycan-associated protein
VPNAEIARVDKLMVELKRGDYRSTDPALIGAIRIAEGGKKILYDELAASGRVATQGIYFDSGSDQLRPESTPTLKEIGTMLQEHGDLRMRIEGHTDSVGEDAYNLDLSGRRAASVKSFIVETYGIDGARLETEGFGETKPVDSNDSAEGRQNNRRVELVKLS